MMYLAGRRTDFDPQSHVWATVRALPGRQQESDIFGRELHSFVVFEKTSTSMSTKSVIVDVHVVVDVAVDGF